MTVVRPADHADLDAVVSLEREVFDLEAWSPQSVESEFDAIAAGRRVLVAVDGTDVVGYAVLSRVEATGDIRRVAVSGERQRQGIATRLVAELLASARVDGCERVLLEVAADNRAGLALYTSAGFTQLARRAGYYARGTDAVVMQLGLVAGQDSRGGQP